MQPPAVIILAAGLGTRMKSTQPKVMHRIAGRSLIGHVLCALEPLACSRTVVVVGHGRDVVQAEVHSHTPGATCVVQEEQLGTGHAVRVALEAVPDLVAGHVLITAGDTPLLRTADLGALCAAATDGAGAVLTADLPDPTGYGRVLRGPAGEVLGIVEHRDATPEQLAIHEVNAGVYVFDVAALREALADVTAANAQGELYLTDVVALLVAQGRAVAAHSVDAVSIMGVNDRQQLATAGAHLRDRINGAHMLAGVTMTDPTSVWVDATVSIAPDVSLLPNVQLMGTTTIASGAVIGPDCTLTDTHVAAGAHLVRVTAEGAVVGEDATVGPYTYLRPGTVLGTGAKAGGFVEMKNAVLGDGAKVPHLSYVGDATIGEGTNVGAATVFVNYDGVEKHHTTVGSHVRIGSDTMLVAPLRIGDGAYTAAGSVITDDVPAGAMAVGRARQRNILGWVARRRPGTRSAQAALADSAGTGEGAGV